MKTQYTVTIIGIVCAAMISAKAVTSFNIWKGVGNTHPVHYLKNAAINTDAAFVFYKTPTSNGPSGAVSGAAYGGKEWYYNHNGSWGEAAGMLSENDEATTFASDTHRTSVDPLVYTSYRDWALQ